MTRKHSHTLAEEIAGRLRSEIEQGTYVSGERLVEMSIAKFYHVSQSTVRDALSVLEREGWVVKRSRHGVFVRSFTRVEALEVCDLMLALQRMTCQEATSMLQDEDFGRLRAALRSARDHLRHQRFKEANDAIFCFHIILVNLLERPLTAQLTHQIVVRVRLLLQVLHARQPPTRQEIDESIEAHEQIIVFLEQRRVDDALHMMTRMVMGIRQSLDQVYAIELQLAYSAESLP